MANSQKRAEFLMLFGAGSAIAIFLSSVIAPIFIYAAGCAACLTGVAWIAGIDWREHEKRMESKRNGDPL